MAKSGKTPAYLFLDDFSTLLLEETYLVSFAAPIYAIKRFITHLAGAIVRGHRRLVGRAIVFMGLGFEANHRGRRPMAVLSHHPKAYRWIAADRLVNHDPQPFRNLINGTGFLRYLFYRAWRAVPRDIYGQWRQIAGTLGDNNGQPCISATAVLAGIRLKETWCIRSDRNRRQRPHWGACHRFPVDDRKRDRGRQLRRDARDHDRAGRNLVGQSGTEDRALVAPAAMLHESPRSWLTVFRETQTKGLS